MSNVNEKLLLVFHLVGGQCLIFYDFCKATKQISQVHIKNTCRVSVIGLRSVSFFCQFES